ncbi:MAG: citrate/2-methylcitrate synthase, partial [Silvanigrellaceae bacterium]|nr:citrate/2-methylcitrate synthase [Silvanigrellaceae bacterium]
MAEDLGFSKGLAGIIADATAVGQVQGEVGRLIYRGVPIEEIAEKSSFEEATYFILKGKFPTQNELNAFITEMKLNRPLAKYAEAVIQNAPRSAHPMSVLQAVIAALSFEEPTVNLKNSEGNIKSSLKLISQLATAVAYISRDRRGLPWIAPRNDLTHAENFLYMMKGEVPSKEESRMFDTALILHIDHDFNASTFTARVVASTESRINVAISAAIGALSGPLHGGANEKVLQMADTIGSADKAKEWVLNAIANKEKVMGFGHRVYRTLDPRAKILRSMLEKIV